MYMGDLSACASVYYGHTWYLWKSDEGVRSLGTRVTDVSETPCRCWELNLSSLPEQLMFLTVEPGSSPMANFILINTLTI